MTLKIQRRHFIFRRLLAAAAGALIPWAGFKKANAEEKPSDPAQAVNDTIKTIQQLRTIHGNFTDREIPDAQIQLILQSSIRAANASNMQSYSIVVVKDRNKMQELCGYKGSCLLVYCVDYNRLIASAQSLGYMYCPDNIVNLITGSVNASLAVQTAAIAARSLGIDYLITNGIHRGDMERVWKLLELPKENCFPLIALVLGYPTKEPDYRMGRLDGAGVIHYEKYQLPNKEQLETITNQYDDPAKHLGLNEIWKDKGYKHYLDWLFKDWARNPKPTDQETQMLKLLKKSRFVELQKM
jgi:nitroreductase